MHIVCDRPSASKSTGLCHGISDVMAYSSGPSSFAAFVCYDSMAIIFERR